MKSSLRRGRSGSRIVFLATLIFLSISAVRPDGVVSGAESDALARVEVRGGLDRIGLPIFASWVSPDQSVTALVIAPLSQIKASGENYRILDSPAEPKDYILAVRSRSGSRREGRAGGPLASLRILLDDGRRLVVRASEVEAEALAASGFEIARLPETQIIFCAAPENLAAAPLSITPIPGVQEMMNEATSTKARTYDGNLSGEWPVTISGSSYTIATRTTRSGTPIAQATQYVYEFMQNLGLQVSFQNWSSGSLSGRNVIGTKIGSTLPNENVLLTAHIDDMPSSGSAPGADDNASGCAAVMMAAEIMSHHSFQRTIRFVFFTGEEQGLYGSAAFAKAASTAGENIVAVLNLDMIAWDKTGGPVVNLHLRQTSNPGYAADLQIAETFSGVVAAYGLSAKITPNFIAYGSGESDHASFWSKGFPAILAIEDDWYDFNSAYHTANDKLALLNLDFFANFTKAAVGTVAHLSAVSSSTRITLSKTSLAFGALTGGPATPGQSVVVGSSDGAALSWTAFSNRTWLAAAPGSGLGNGAVTVSVNASGLSNGSYSGTLGISESGGSGSPANISVTLTVIGGGGQYPFGSFDAPKDGLTVMSSIAVTGWALDDIEVTGVKIYRKAIEGEPAPPNGLIYIGDAVFAEGARPDVETAYPGYPLNSRGGWGYMLLTNFLPNGGNGTFTLLATTTDKEGHQIEIGRKSIGCDNRNAVKPFGAIDTPTQGGAASGGAYINFGWALTPSPKSIPIDGSTMTVWVDGLPLGHPTYNNYRADIAALFPGYANSNGAVGYYYLITTGYENKVHTIAWSVADSVGAVDGIGSRYFQILNAGSGSAAGGMKATISDIAGGTEAKVFGAADRTKTIISRTGDGKESMISWAAGYGEDPESFLTAGARRLPATLLSISGARSIAEIQNLHTDLTSPVHVRRGYDFDRTAESVFPNREGSLSVSIAELERAAIYLDPAQAWETREELEARGRELRGMGIPLRSQSRIYFVEGTNNSRGDTIGEKSVLGMKNAINPALTPSIPVDPFSVLVANPRYSAFLLVGSELRPLPIGSTFDAERGVLYWQPGPGFLGDYEFIFLDSHRNTKKAVKIRIGTK